MLANDKQPSFEENVKNSFLRVKEHVSILESELRADREFVIRQNDQIRFLLEEIRLISAENRELRQKLSILISKSSIGNDGVYSDIHSFIHSLDIHSLDIQTKSGQNEGIKQTNIVPSQHQEEILVQPKSATSQLEQNKRDELDQDFRDTEGENNDSKLSQDKSLPLQKEVIYDQEKQGQKIMERKEFKPPIMGSSSRNLLHGHLSIVGLKSEINSLFSSLSKQEFLTFLTVYQQEEDLEGYVSYIDVAAKLGLTEGCIRTYVSSLMKKGIPIIKTKYNNKVVYLSVSKDFRALNIKKDLMTIYYKADPTQKTLF